MVAARQVSLFNSELEAGMRSVAVLTAFFPQSLGLRQLSLFDYFVVHTGDLEEGPESLHPKISSRKGEYFVRRQVVQGGLRLMIRAGLICEQFSKNGITYSVTETSSALANLAGSDYNKRLFECADWLARQSAEATDGRFEEELFQRIGQWGLDIEIEESLNERQNEY